MDEADILLAARQMIRLHGPAAASAAAARAEKMREQEDREGFHVWTRIGDTIRDLDRRNADTQEV